MLLLGTFSHLLDAQRGSSLTGSYPNLRQQGTKCRKYPKYAYFEKAFEDFFFTWGLYDKGEGWQLRNLPEGLQYLHPVQLLWCYPVASWD